MRITDRIRQQAIPERIGRNLRDVAVFGPWALRRHVGRLRKDPTTSVRVRGIGRMHVRAGESDFTTIRQVFGEREYALHPADVRARVQRRYSDILGAGRRPIIVDAGANIGAATLWFAHEFPDAAVVAIEPDPDNLEVLRQNVGQRPNCVILPAAIGAEPGFVALSKPEASWAVQSARADAGVAIVTVDDAFRRSGGDEPFIVKVDIEGFESDLFASNLDWLDRTYAVFIEPHDWMLPGRMSSLTFQRAMAQHEFELFLRGENLLYVRV